MQDLCLFAHFDPDDKVDEHVLHYLECIKDLNFAVVFISTSCLDRSEVDALNRVCYDIILRENAGLDFGSWAEGFQKHGASAGGRLLLANDSVYGPIGTLHSAFDRLTRYPSDFYGLVESIEISPHLQSWFLLFEPWVVRHPAFKAILTRPFSKMKKEQIIAKGEVGLCRQLINAGFRYQALYLNSRAGLSAQYHPINPMHFLWRELLLEEGIPFLKVELLRDNPAEVEYAEAILSEIESLDPQFCCIIRAHLARVTTRPDRFVIRRRGLNAWVAKHRKQLAREGYRLRRDNLRGAEVCNFIKLLPFVIAVRARKLLR